MQNIHTVVRLYHTILSHLNYGILVVNADEHIAFVNDLFCVQLGLAVSAKEIIGLSSEAALRHILPAYEDPQATLRLIQDMVSQGGSVLGAETRLKNGRAILVDFVPIVVDGQNQGRIWQHRDNTDRKQIEGERERLILELQEAQSRIPPVPTFLRQEKLWSSHTGAGRKWDEQGSEYGKWGGGVESPQTPDLFGQFQVEGSC